uniref:GRF-type domain-containing protein n=1 Tax=Nelumbo nucifera TaxID=4432 RepID=A0A822XCP4_NELNU|nr:TPA_asm: hypothetical protein HUJ06_019573 [Nelumbo nucifera]
MNVVCPCSGECVIVVARNGKPENVGQQFYGCHYYDAGDCKFFSWVTPVDNITMKADDGSGPSRINERSSMDTLDEVVAVVQSKKDSLDRMSKFCDKLLKRIKDLRIKDS